MQDLEAKPAADKTFANFHPFIQHNFTKCVKHDKSMAKSVGKGIANEVKEEEDALLEIYQAAWALGKVVRMMQAAQEKKNEKLMKMFTIIKLN